MLLTINGNLPSLGNSLASKPFILKLFRKLRRFYLQFLYSGNTVNCPICLGQYKSWYNNVDSTNPEINTCPGCWSQNRHRLLWILLNQQNQFENTKRVLHFAPWECLEKEFRSLKNWNYVTSDLFNPGVDVHTDITNMIFQDQSFDIITCSHVLEHISDDKAAMSELYRVLASKGGVYILVPYNKDAVTDEDPTVVDLNERAKRFRGAEHVRLYGNDLSYRLRVVGFQVEEIWLTRKINAQSVQKYGLSDEVIFYCCKP